ncbi:GNAT family N-acetyltransferase [Streptomyces massasporeus]|uniref:GNAT family N-acetyltransferase n=1 Tax=Streptomyces massasporeus TaxID=67324 RepID=UPI003662D344
MTARWRDVTPTWDGSAATLRGVWPYHTTAWGNLVADVFGGRFRVLHEPDHGFYAPILVGGSLADDGFLSGHVGYGGFLAPPGIDVSLRAQAGAVRDLASDLGIPCRRLVTTPETPRDTATGAARQTVLVDLTGGADALWASYEGSVRTAVRKCSREGLRTRRLGSADVPDAVGLIRATQRRVGAAYEVPEPLIERLACDETGFAVIVGCHLGERLLSVGVFLRAAGRAAYLYNGWDPAHASLGANYLMLHDAMRVCAGHGDHVLDLGYSHARGLREFKDRWGGRPATVTVLDRSASTADRSAQEDELTS